MSVPSSSIIKSTGISKTLLTPYRRIGLSRRSKPNKTFNSPLQETQFSVEAGLNLQQNENSSYIVDNSEKNLNSQVREPASLRNKLKVKDTGVNIHSVNIDSKKSHLNPVDSLEKTTVSQVKEFAPQRKKQEDNHDDIDSVKALSKKSHAKAATTVTNSKSDCKVINKTTESIEWLDHLQRMVAEEEELNESSVTYTPPKIDADVLKQLQSKELKVCVTRMHSIKRKSMTTTPSTPHRKVKRKLSMKKSTNSHDMGPSDTDDDEIGLFKHDTISDDVTDTKENIPLQEQSTGVLDKEVGPSLIDEILQLEKQVKEKEVYLSKLQQAEVYHNMHNVEDLNRVTSIWKVKCEEGLRDLLGKLKEHALLDMSTLLKNLNVPSNLISYNSEEDVFV